MTKNIDSTIEALKKQIKDLRKDKRTEIMRQRKADAEKKAKDATRRKILLGAIVENMMAKDEKFGSQMLNHVDTKLVRDDERELFGLPPLALVSAVSQQEPLL